MKIAIYSRKSKFTGKGESIGNQIELCQEYASNHFKDTEFIIYEDEGFSGSNIDRPRFKQLMKDAERGKFEVLMCYRLDRISRSIVDFSTIIEKLEKHDVAFISIREQFDTSTPMGRAMLYIASVFAQLERETIAERIRDNLLKLARTGRWLGGKPPTGFKGEKEYYYDEDMNKRSSTKLVEIKEELELVRRIYNKYLEFNSLSKLHSWTLQNHVKTKNDKNFDMSALKTILTNTVYVKSDELVYEWFKSKKYDLASEKKDFKGNGVFTFNKFSYRNNKQKIRDQEEWIVTAGNHKGIISSIDWLRVQEMLETNATKSPRSDSGENGLLTPIMYCSCGSRMKILLKYTNGVVKHHYYKCKKKDVSRSTHCNSKNVQGNKADELIVEELFKLAEGKGSLAKQLDNRAKNIQVDSKDFDTMKKEIDIHTKTIENLTNNLGQSSVADKYIIKQIEEVDSKINQLQSELSKIEDKKLDNLLLKQSDDILKENITKFKNEYHKVDIHKQREILKLILKRIEWDGSNLKAYLR